MSLKNEILALLEGKKGCPVSGQEIAGIFNVSRSAVWKNINLLKEEGHKINAVSNKGYTLDNFSDILSFEGIRTHLNESFKDINLYVHDEVTSTNILAKHLSCDNPEKTCVIIANSQTQGRGRRGRIFYSPSDTGIYMSFLINPIKFSQETVKVTIAAAVAVKEALENITQCSPKIKWVNDIFINGKKVCGILTEAVTDIETNEISWIVVGIGINVTTNSFPNEIDSIAGCVSHSIISRNKIAAEVINRFLSYYQDLSNPQIIKEYKNSSLILGKTITYTKNNVEYTAVAEDINDSGNLIVDCNGVKDILTSGEVSLHSSSFTDKKKE